MSLSNMLFLFLFLPISLGVYYSVNDRAKEYVLLFISLLFYAVGSLQYLVLFVAAVFVTVLLGRAIHATTRKTTNKVLLIAGILFNLGLLIYYKYTDFILSTINDVSGAGLALRRILLPLGISFYTFKAISYLTDVYTGKAVLDENPLHDALYLSFFAQVQSGPLTRYHDMHRLGEGAQAKSMDLTLFREGVFRFIIGFNKKVLLADVLSKITTEIFSAPFADFSTAYAWLGSVCYSLQLFYDFAGYSDMAIGISNMFGYECRENFLYPYTTPSVSKFWRKWHVTLGEWFRDYVYIPMGGSRNKTKSRLVLNLFVVWLLTGIWHGASWNFILWGLGYFVVICFEHLSGYPGKFRSKAGKILYRIASLLFINCQWVVFRMPEGLESLRFIKRMFIYQANALADFRTLFLLKEYWVFLAAALVLCAPVFPWISKKLEGKGKLSTVFDYATGIVVFCLFVVALSFVVSGHNNPFAYANF